MTIKGTIEVLTGDGPDDESFGWPVAATDPEQVPGTASGLGYTAVTPVTPQERANQMPTAEWTAVHPTGVPVSIVLWEETVFDETMLGRALASVREEVARDG